MLKQPLYHGLRATYLLFFGRGHLSFFPPRRCGCCSSARPGVAAAGRDGRTRGDRSARDDCERLERAKCFIQRHFPGRNVLPARSVTDSGLFVLMSEARRDASAIHRIGSDDCKRAVGRNAGGKGGKGGGEGYDCLRPRPGGHLRGGEGVYRSRPPGAGPGGAASPCKKRAQTRQTRVNGEQRHCVRAPRAGRGGAGRSGVGGPCFSARIRPRFVSAAPAYILPRAGPLESVRPNRRDGRGDAGRRRRLIRWPVDLSPRRASPISLPSFLLRLGDARRAALVRPARFSAWRPGGATGEWGG